MKSLHNIEIVSFQFIDQAVSLKRRHYEEPQASHTASGFVAVKTTVLQKYTFAVILYSVNSQLPGCAGFVFSLVPQV